MPKLLVFQHVSFEILGRFDPLLKDHGFRIRYVNFDRHPEARPRLDGYDGLVILGGPMSVTETSRYPHLATELDLIRRAIDRRLPILGICLGAQLVARALGAEVGPNGRKEIGWYEVSPTREGREDPLLQHFGGSEAVFQWHGDVFGIPDGAVHLASSAHCTHQAFRHGDNVYGFQFHLEVDERLIGRWLRTPVHRAEIEASHGDIDPDEISRVTPLHILRSADLADRVFCEFMRLFGPLRRRFRHPHR
jgi:GMP synthase (glutamine-hydrolysing)